MCPEYAGRSSLTSGARRPERRRSRTYQPWGYHGPPVLKTAEIWLREEPRPLLRRRFRPGGRLTVWAAAADTEFEARLHDRFDAVRAVTIPVSRGDDDIVYVAEASPARSP